MSKHIEIDQPGGLSALKGAFGEVTDQDTARQFSKVQAFKENQIFLGQESGSSGQGMAPINATALAKFHRKLEKDKANGKGAKSYDVILHLALMDNLKQQADELQKAIQAQEDAFAEKYGDDWREKTAEQILDPEDMPHRKPGQSIEDFREELERALIKEFLNEDGSIKDEYKDHPEFGNRAKWAQKQYDQSALDNLISKLNDPDLSHDEKQELINQYNDSPSAAADRNGPAEEFLNSDLFERFKPELVNNDEAVDNLAISSFNPDAF